jgi:hypothetical protein
MRLLLLLYYYYYYFTLVCVLPSFFTTLALIRCEELQQYVLQQQLYTTLQHNLSPSNTQHQEQTSINVSVHSIIIDKYVEHPIIDIDNSSIIYYPYYNKSSNQ